MMRNLTSILILLTFVFSLSAQDKMVSDDQTRFEEILELYYDEEYNLALDAFNEFLNEYPNSPLIPRAKYNVGYINLELNNHENAITIFEEILNGDFNEYEEYGGFMEEYTLYKHRSAKNIATIYLEKKEYKKAIKYIRQFDKKYKYKHFCGNELSANRIFTSYSYARYYFGVGNYEKALKLLTPHLFYNGLADSDYLIPLIDKILNQMYSSEEITQLLKESKSSLKMSKKGHAFIHIFNSKIEVFDYELFRISNPDMMANLDLQGEEKFKKVVESNPLFAKYKKK